MTCSIVLELRPSGEGGSKIDARPLPGYESESWRFEKRVSRKRPRRAAMRLGARCAGVMPSPPKIVKRLAEHETKTVPVIEKYSQLHGVVKVDGMGSFEEVFERTSRVLESLFRSG